MDQILKDSDPERFFDIGGCPYQVGEDDHESTSWKQDGGADKGPAELNLSVEGMTDDSLQYDNEDPEAEEYACSNMVFVANEPLDNEGHAKDMNVERDENGGSQYGEPVQSAIR